jgi:CDP-diacylglycerol--glycerol-3-phosphate 3-phosphatidyltransferase
VAALVIAGTIGLALRGIAATAVPATEDAPDAPLLGPRVRGWYKSILDPIQRRLVAWEVHPDALTWAQLAVSVLAGAAFAAGAMFLAGWLTILAGTLDIFDGALARARGTASARGAYLDSVVDRWAEVATFAGVGAWFRDSWLLGAVALAAVGSLMVSYARARAEGLGLALLQGSMQRPERYVLLGFGAWISGLVGHVTCTSGGSPGHWVLGGAVCVLAALSTWTAVRRAQLALRALGESERR